MGNRLSFYFSQGSKNLKNSVLIVLGLGLALSMVSGISLYIDSYQRNLVNESFYQILDFNVIQHEHQYLGDISESLLDNDDSIISTFQNAENLDIESNFRYYTLSSNYLTFFRNYSKLYGHTFDGHDYIEGNYLNLGLFDEDFYSSKRFDAYFSIINGTSPKSEEEIMIPIDFAYKMNLTLGETSTLDINPSWGSETSNSSLSLSDVKVVGIYVGKLKFYRFSNKWLDHSYTYYSENNTVTDYEDLGRWSSSEFVFSYYNYTKRDSIHPVQNLINDYTFLQESNSSETFDNTYLEKQAGLGICFNRNNIDFNHLNSYSRSISQETQIIERQINKGDCYLRDYLSEHLFQMYLESSLMRIVLQILNIPILIFAIFIGSFAIKTNTKSRLDEFLLLRSKGSPTSLLRNQFLIEAIFIGITSSTLALFAGFGTFYGFRNLLDEIFFGFNSTTVLSPVISWGTVILTYSFGVGITFLASFSSIFYVGKLPTDQLLGILGSDSMGVEYDEKSLFGTSEGKKVSIEETPFYEESQDQQSFESEGDIIKDSSSKNFISELKKKSILRKRRKHALYHNAIKIQEKKNPKLSIAFITVSLFPLMLYFLYYLGSLPSVPDVFISISVFILQYFWIIIILAIFSPVLFVVGIIRILVVEKPSRFARISKFISSIFLKNRSYLCGIEMVKRKQYKTVIFLVGIFTSLLVFTNVFINSLSRYDVMFNNLDIGSDIHVGIVFETMNITNSNDIELFESQLKSYKTPENETLINQVLTYYREVEHSEYSSSSKFYFDIEKYLDIIQEDDKKLPVGDFISKIEDLIDYNKNSSNTIPSVIVNEGFLVLNNLKIGDLFSFTHSYYNSTSEFFQNETITVKMGISANVMPGFYIMSDQWGYYQEEMIIDISSVNQDKKLLHGIEIYQMIDIDLEIEDDYIVLEGMLNNASIGYVEYERFEFYVQDWDDLNYEVELSESGFYGIIYLEFTVIGILLAFGLAILILSFQRENKYFNGVLLARGFGRAGLLKLILSQIFIIFLLGIFTGLLSGFLTSFTFLRIFTTISYGSGIISFPLFVNGLELVEMLSIIVLSSFVIYLVSYYFEAKKNITEYFHKF